ncbi:MAG: HDIG domain-containing protein, partial [Firmicutes bacterium]|nr:HDIG domain-containing protein [Bacillota bacterium]
AFVLTAVFIATGSFAGGEDVLSVGSISPQRYVAGRDIVDEKATEMLRQQARESVGVLYKHDPDVTESAIENAELFFNNLEDISAGFPNSSEAAAFARNSSLNIPVVFSREQYEYYFQLSDMGSAEYRNDILSILRSTFEQGITSDTISNAQELAEEKLAQTEWSTNLKEMAALIVSAILTPNLVEDTEAIAAAQEKKASEVEDVIIRRNQKIVDEGEIITQDIYDLLIRLNLINAGVSDSILPVFGSIIIMALVFAAASLYFSSYLNDRKKYPSSRFSEKGIIFILYCMAILVAWIMSRFENFNFLPLTLFTMIAAMLTGGRLALLFNLVISLAGVFIFRGNLDFFLYFSATGTLSCMVMQMAQRRSYTMFVAALTAGINIVAYISIAMFVENGFRSGLMLQAVLAGLTGLLSVIIAIGSLPLWEAVFEVNTPLKLLELINPSNELMHRLMLEAPGTYHHSLLVANLAESACHEIGANPTLARVGAYYHDIGKLKYPLYFTENQSGSGNPHELLDPYTSVKIIREHIRYGYELALANRLPKPITDMVCQHHGTTTISYFYVRAVQQYGAENVNEEDFKYPGPIPQFREAGVLMLADTVEAAVRANISAGADISEIENIIKALFKQKLDAGQLDDCLLTIKDLETIREAFMTVFGGMYHKRIQYPTLSEEEKRQVELKNAEKEASEGNAADISSSPDFVSERTTEDEEPEILLFGRPYKETAESARGNTDDDID